MIGVIHVLAYDDRCFNQADLDLMTSFANQAAMVIQNARLHNGLEKQNRVLLALQEAMLPLIQQLDISEVLQTVISQAAQMLNTTHGFIYLSTADNRELELMTGMGKFTGHIGNRLQPGEGLAGKIWQSGQPSIVPEYRSWEGRSSQFEEMEFRSVIGVPLFSGKNITGVLGLAHLHSSRGMMATTWSC